MTFQTLDSAQKWAKQHGRHIFVELDGLKGVLEVYPGGRTIWRDANLGKVYQRYRQRLTPDQEFRDSEFDHMKRQKDEILQRQREAIERPLLAEIDALRLLLRRALQLPRPWLDGGITWEKWDELFSDIEKAIK